MLAIHQSDYAALLLAAGRSSRMGAFKPLLPWGAITVIESCVRMLRDGGVNEIVVVTGHREIEVRQALCDGSVRFATNPDPDSQMGASVACGIEALSGAARAVFIALVDQPAVPSEVIHNLIESQATGGALIFIPEFRGRGGHPILVDLSLRDELASLDQNRGLRGLIEKFESATRRVSVDSPFVTRDMDIWHDYLSLHRDALGLLPI